MLKQITLPLVLMFSVSSVPADAGAEFLRVQTHAGKTDTDGHLSPGELPNPGIDYDRMQRDKLRQGDYRFQNPYNDAAAEQSRRQKYDRGRHDWRHDPDYYEYENDDRYYDDYDDRDRYYDRDRRRNSRWWD